MRFSLRFALLFAVTLLLQRPADAASFDCSKAQSAREHAVCGDAKLSALDSQLGAQYTATLNALGPAERSLVKQDQRIWLQWLDGVCPLHPKEGESTIQSCLSSEYSSRRKYLRLHRDTSDNILIYTRTFYSYSPNAPGDKDVADNDPGFGQGTFAWPQIDRPTEQQKLWNSAVYAAALKTTEDDHNKAPASFATANGTGGTTDVDYNLRALNGHWIVSDVVFSEYGYGAAHPNSSVVTVNWSLDRGRVVRPADVFRDGSEWKAALTARVVAGLKAQPDLRDGLAEDSALESTVQDEAKNVSAWTLTRSGLTVSFGQYEIGPYSIGMPSATVHWTALSRYLAPSFRPEELSAELSANF